MTRGDSVDLVCGRLYEYLNSNVEQSFHKIELSPGKNRFPRNVWVDSDCKDLKAHLTIFPKQHNISVSESWLENRDLEKDYKRLIPNRKINLKCSQLQTFENMVSKNPNEYWRFWKKSRLIILVLALNLVVSTHLSMTLKKQVSHL